MNHTDKLARMRATNELHTTELRAIYDRLHDAEFHARANEVLNDIPWTEASGKPLSLVEYAKRYGNAGDRTFVPHIVSSEIADALRNANREPGATTYYKPRRKPPRWYLTPWPSPVEWIAFAAIVVVTAVVCWSVK